MAKDLSNDPFFDIDTIFHVLQNYVKSDKESLSLTEDGKLSYSCQVIFGNLAKKSGFTIDLEKQDLDPQTKQQKSFNNLALKVSKMEESLNTQVKTGFEQIMKLNEERFKTFEKSILEKLSGIENILSNATEKIKSIDQFKEQKVEVKVEYLFCSFDTAGVFASKYNISENNKVATAKDTTYYILPASKPLPANQISRFTLSIIEEDWIMIGILPEEARDKRSPYSHRVTVGYSGSGQFFRLAGVQNDLITYTKGDIVSMEVDLQSGRVNLSVNNKKVFEHVINKEDLSYQYYPFIYTTNKVGCGAKFV